MSLKVYIALAVSVISLIVALVNWSWVMLVNAITAYLLANSFALECIMRHRK